MPKPPERAVLIFVDGLRMDVAHRLAELLRARGASAQLTWRWSGFPTVTATCKPLASPAAATLNAGSLEMLTPSFGGRQVTKPILLRAINAAGWATADDLVATGPMWMELGEIDESGHANGAKLAVQVADELAGIAETVMRLAQEGRRVRIVTDHGWLLMPGCLPFAELPSGMSVPKGRGHRTALLKEGAPTSYDRLPWTWDSATLLAAAPGARAFYNGVEYAHGGISPQECVLPVIDVTADQPASALVIKATWNRLRLRIEVAGGAGLMFDVRSPSSAFGPSLLPKGPRPLDDAGQVNVLVPDEYVGKEVLLVVYPAGAPADVRISQTTTIEG